MTLKNRFDTERENYSNNPKAASQLMGILLRRYWSEVTAEPCALWDRIFKWGGAAGHYSLLSTGEDQAHAVLARDEWGIIWC